jgi:two-component system cell cycle sensor histidine kinase/response regulator CckA
LLEIQNAVNKASSLTHQLLIFSRQGNSEKHRIDLNEKIVEMVKMIKRIIDNNIKVEISQDENIEAINADPVNLEQVIMNLVVNARDAMPKGGVITIKTGVPSDAKIERPDKAGNEDNSYVYFEISDTGAGMDEETLSRIFEPFYTTKSRSKGTGLGLSVVYGIVDEHEGYIKVKSTPGKGTSFKVYLPVYSKKHVKPNLTVDGERIADSKGECILIIEDEAALLSVSSRALISRGYKTLLASNGEEARKIFKERKYEISLIFSDVMLPDENGILLVKDLKEDKGDVKVLLTSGYAGEKYNLEETISGDIKHIPKPYKLPVLFAKIREMLD